MVVSPWSGISPTQGFYLHRTAQHTDIYVPWVGLKSHQDSRSPGRYLNPGPPEYEAGVLTTRPRRSVEKVLCSAEYSHEIRWSSTGIHTSNTYWNLHKHSDSVQPKKSHWNLTGYCFHIFIPCTVSPYILLYPFQTCFCFHPFSFFLPHSFQVSVLSLFLPSPHSFYTFIPPVHAVTEKKTTTRISRASWCVIWMFSSRPVPFK
jgi:hypothetical protein